MCTIKQGAKFYPSVEIGDNVIYELEDEDMEIEALCEQDDWTCVVLSGIDLGWVTNDHILTTEHESVDRAAHESAVSVEWIFERFSGLNSDAQFTPELLGMFGSLLKHSKRYVASATLDGNEEGDAILPVVLQHCVSLQYLSFCGRLSDAGMDTLVEKLVESALVDTLLLLKFEQSDFGSASVEKISGFLSNLIRIPELLDLRLDVPHLYSPVYVMLLKSTGRCGF